MIKKIIVTGIFTILALLINQFAIGQVYTYEDMPVDVKNQMNLNKQGGLPSWGGIIFSFHVTVAGLENEEHQVLMERASKKHEIISVKFDNNNVVIVDCAGGTNFDMVKGIFSTLVTSIPKIENKAYISKTLKE